MAQNPEVNFRHYAITTRKAASVGESQNRQSRCKLRTGPKRVPPVSGINFMRYHPSVALILALQAHCEASSHGKFCDPGIWGGDQGCVRSDLVDPVRVGQHPANAGGGRS